jgi:hypothetical protein
MSRIPKIPNILRDHLERDGMERQSDGNVDPERLMAARIICNRLALLMAKGHYVASDRAYTEAVVEMKHGTCEPFLKTPITDTGISERNATMIERRFGALRIGDLLHITTAKLMLVPMVADKTVDAVWHPVLRYAAKRVDGE